MKSAPSALLRRLAAALTLCGAVATLGVHPAEARVFVGLGFGFPVYPPYYPPPVYYPPPPVVYAPPPVVYTPPPPAYSPAPSYGQTCFAGQYTCPMERPVPYGAACYCTGNNGQRVTGRAN
jgi:hypothetical protein